MNPCEQCGYENPEGFVLCERCGTSLELEEADQWLVNHPHPTINNMPGSFLSHPPIDEEKRISDQYLNPPIPTQPPKWVDSFDSGMSSLGLVRYEKEPFGGKYYTHGHPIRLDGNKDRIKPFFVIETPLGNSKTGYKSITR